ncbi:hypothetical protein AJ80_06500 [Polytolypa hystricis UAMH7299]|uniref:Uncharacterized protein n=1 Tax=Polytolypa hystricis (strain UAMH7299) TaxID=1447883 RepID=A0A2B7XUY5_POLH7|nr:hypothetical protein AJ80_06500 [Polytolypa hystricis UAMH7299]
MGFEGFSESVAKEMNPDWNTKFLIVEPGGVRTKFGGSSLKMASRHPAYDTHNSAFNQLMAHMDDPASQATWCDPDICAQVLFDTVVGQDERPLPIRLLMGADTISVIKDDIERNLKDMDEWKEETLRCSPQGGSQVRDLSI